MLLCSKGPSIPASCSMVVLNCFIISGSLPAAAGECRVRGLAPHRCRRDRGGIACGGRDGTVGTSFGSMARHDMAERAPGEGEGRLQEPWRRTSVLDGSCGHLGNVGPGLAEVGPCCIRSSSASSAASCHSARLSSTRHERAGSSAGTEARRNAASSRSPIWSSSPTATAAGPGYACCSPASSSFAMASTGPG